MAAISAGLNFETEYQISAIPISTGKTFIRNFFSLLFKNYCREFVFSSGKIMLGLKVLASSKGMEA